MPAVRSRRFISKPHKPRHHRAKQKHAPRGGAPQTWNRPERNYRWAKRPGDREPSHVFSCLAQKFCNHRDLTEKGGLNTGSKTARVLLALV
jgi:hypothetical protein